MGGNSMGSSSGTGSYASGKSKSGGGGGMDFGAMAGMFGGGGEEEAPPEPLGDGGLEAMIQALIQGASSREAQLISQYGGTDGRRR